MFNFNKKNDDEKVLKSALNQFVGQSDRDLVKDAEIHVMPSKFLVANNNSVIKKKTVVLVGVFLIIITCFVAGVILFIFKSSFINEPISNQAAEKIKTEKNDDNDKYIKGENILTEEEKKPESTPDIATSTAEIATSTPEIATSTAEIATSTAEIATSTAEIATSTIESAQVLDSDKDGLTDLEEELFGSDKLDDDFDNDGYLDGIEAYNLYNPISYAPQKLSESGIVKIYNESRFNIFYPIGWEIKIIEEGNISFKSANGEFIELIISPNPDSISPEDWYKIQLGMEEDGLTGFFENIKSGTNKRGLYYIKINESTVYLSDYNYIYVLSYNFGATNKINFPSVFEIMTQSLESKVDTDGDGIVDYLEIDIYKTDPKKADTDSDGFNDGEEIKAGYDPLK
ncbi:MAG: hypothetical protein V1891_00270 [bacterium]